MDYQIFAVQRYKFNVKAATFYEYHNKCMFFRFGSRNLVAVGNPVLLSAVSFSAAASKGCRFHQG